MLPDLTGLSKVETKVIAKFKFKCFEILKQNIRTIESIVSVQFINIGLHKIQLITDG